MPSRATSLIVAAAGLAGVASLLAAPLDALVPASLRAELTGIHPLVFLIQPAVLVVIASIVGALLARRVGLAAPLVEAAVAGRLATANWREIAYAGLLAGLFGGIVLAVYTRLAGPAPIEMPLVTRILYGGVTEEVMMRWGVMTLFVWGLSFLGGRNSWVYLVGAALAALVFALGHLPALFALMPDASLGFVAIVLAANAVLGLVFGILYWRRGLEAAFLAHAATHVFASLFLAALTGMRG